ncbi:MAG: crossover junction endodeoxyribonuclease RuvC [Desulfobacterales bacterium]|nr:crossover junction endodeoxyribonuclease RuvC [Desulfobacterales bacterium]
MLVLGIDPGVSVTGYGIIEELGGRLLHIYNGGISSSLNNSFPYCLKEIYAGLEKIISDYSPNVMAIENLFFHKNVKTALKLGHARGIAILAALNAGLDVYEYSPMEIKQAVVGYGRATKDQIQIMVKELLNLPEIVSFDPSDALAVAICHIHSTNMREALKKSI